MVSYAGFGEKHFKNVQLKISDDLRVLNPDLNY